MKVALQQLYLPLVKFLSRLQIPRLYEFDDRFHKVQDIERRVIHKALHKSYCLDYVFLVLPRRHSRYHKLHGN